MWVMIPIYFVNSTTDSIRQRVVLFKSVTVPTSDLKSEFLCQSSLIAQNLQTFPWTTSYTWDISHALITTYHPYTHEPSALTKYLKQKLRAQHAKWLSHSHLAQVKPSVPLERNNGTVPDWSHWRWCCCSAPPPWSQGVFPELMKCWTLPYFWRCQTTCAWLSFDTEARPISQGHFWL